MFAEKLLGIILQKWYRY